VISTPHETVSQPDIPPVQTQAALWHTLEVSDALARLGTDPANGLSEDEVRRRRAEFGANVLEARAGRSPWAILRAFLRQSRCRWSS